MAPASVRRVPRKEDERGAILVIAAISLTMVVFAAALAVDIGGRAEERRNDQKISDMAALDAVQYLSSANLTQEAENSLLRNSFTGPSDQLLDVTPGQYVNGTWIPNAEPFDAVKVDVSSQYRDFFGQSSGTLNGSSIAMLQSVARFQIGSTLLSVGTCPSTPPSPPAGPVTGTCSLLNTALGALGASTGLDLVGYQGLANGNVTLAQLGAALGLSALTPDQLLATNVTADQLATAAATLLGSNSTGSAELSAVGTSLLNSSSDTSHSFQLGNALGITQGTGVGLGTTVNLLNVVTGGVELANGEAGITIPFTTVNLGPFGNVTVSLTGIVPAAASPDPAEPPGPQNAATDTQVTLNMTVSLQLTVGLSLYAVTLPLQMTVGGAHAYVSAINGCTSGVTTPASITLPTTFNDLTVDVDKGTVQLAGINVATVDGAVTQPSDPVKPDPSIADPLNFKPMPPAPGGNVPYTVSSNPGAPTSTLVLTDTSLAAPIVNAVTTALTTALINGPTSLVSALTTTLDPVLASALSLHVGSADLLGLQNTICGEPELVR